MAYIDFSAATNALTAEYTVPAARAEPSREPSLSALEWSVVALAERDHPSTLRTPGPMAIALGRLFGNRTDARLADERLEALRRMAVLSWHYGYVVPSTAIREFLTAGFTPDQYELLVNSISAARARRTPRTVQ